MDAPEGLLEAEAHVRVIVIGPGPDASDQGDGLGDWDGLWGGIEPDEVDESARATPVGADERDCLASGYDLDDRKSLGRLGEEIAARYLLACGYEIIERNWRCRSGEADIVAHDPQGEVVLVEVKTRRGSMADPLESVDERKRRKYRDIGLCYLYETRCSDCLRFDAIAVNVVDGAVARLRHCLGVLSWDN